VNERCDSAPDRRACGDRTVTTVAYPGTGQPPAEPAGTSTTIVEAYPVTPDTVCLFDQPPAYCGPTTTVLNG